MQIFNKIYQNQNLYVQTNHMFDKTSKIFD